MTHITPAVLGRLKAQLRATLPQVRSSHASEALAAGLGFAKHASLLAAMRENRETERLLDPTLLSERLSSLGYEISESDRAAVKALLSDSTSLATENSAEPAEACNLIYELVAPYLRNGIPVSDSLAVIADALSRDGTPLERLIRKQILTILGRVQDGQSFANAMRDMIPPLEYVVIQAGDASGNIGQALERAMELSMPTARGPQAARAIMLSALSSLLRSGVREFEALELLSSHPGEYSTEVNDHIRHLATNALGAVKNGQDMGTALRKEYPSLEWVLFGPKFKFTGDPLEALETASARLLAALPRT